MLSKLKNFFRGGTIEQSSMPSAQTGSFQPEQPLYIVGDVHGCCVLLDKALDTVKSHVDVQEIENEKLILLGDYVDRGPQSAQVLDKIFALQTAKPDCVICLMGNHEKMMLDFIDDPVGRGNRWLQFGGAETLQSYGIEIPQKKADVEDLTEASMSLEEAMPKGLQDWLRALPLSFQSGNIICVHAGMDPERSLENQSDRVLLWGHSAFMHAAREDDLWVAHGHTIVKTASCQDSRISLDTGAYQSGRLTVGFVTQGQCNFL